MFVHNAKSAIATFKYKTIKRLSDLRFRSLVRSFTTNCVQALWFKRC